MAAASQAGKSDLDVDDLLCALSTGGGVAQSVLIEVGWMYQGNTIVGHIALDEGQLRESAFITEIIEIVREEATALHHRYVGTEHLLLAVARPCPQPFRNRVRQEVVSIVGLGLPER